MMFLIFPCTYSRSCLIFLDNQVVAPREDTCCAKLPVFVETFVPAEAPFDTPRIFNTVIGVWKSGSYADGCRNIRTCLVEDVKCMTEVCVRSECKVIQESSVDTEVVRIGLFPGDILTGYDAGILRLQSL